MKRVFYIVDGEKRQICYRKRVNTYFDANESPRRRKGENAVSAGFCCGGCGLCVGFINSKAPFLHLSALGSIAWGMVFLALTLFTVGTIFIKMADNDTKDHKCKKGNLPWLDPYHLVDKYPNSDPARKLYYIVDSEKNAIVDVKRLGKWGQRYVEWRGRRQKGGA